MKIYMYPNLVKPNSRKYTEQACAVLISEGAQICMEEEYREIFGELYEIEYLSQTECVEKCDVIVVTGGDGTILRCSSVASMRAGLSRDAITVSAIRGRATQKAWLSSAKRPASAMTASRISRLTALWCPPPIFVS